MFASVATIAPAPPLPSDPAESARWEETRRRRRMLDGTWREDLEIRLQAHLGSVRREAWGPIALSINPFRNICRELAVLYDVPPEVRHADAASAALLASVLRAVAVWPLMQRVQAYTIGAREYLVRADVDAAGRIMFRPVPPDLVLATPADGRPDRIGAITEWRLRALPGGRCDWYADVLDPEAEVYRIEDRDGVDVSERFDVAGWPAAWRWEDGRALLPYTLYHAQRTGDRLWEPWESIELVESSLDLAVLNMMLLHTFRDASWPQRYGMDIEPVGASEVAGTGHRVELVTDPATVALFQRRPDADAQPLIGQWQPGGDVEKMEAVLANLVARVAQDAGVPPSDVQRLGGTARSGVAISLTNEGKRQAQRRFAETFRASDEALVSVAAAMLNRTRGAGLPEDGWEVVYREIPLSPEELKARREHVLAMREAGLMSDVEAYRELHPGLSAEQAAVEITQIRAAAPVAEGGADA